MEKTGNLSNLSNLSNLATYGGTALADQRRSRALDRNGVGYLGDLLSGAISADGERVSAVHYGKQLLEHIDPNEYGRGLSGRTVSEINLSHEPDWQNRFFAALDAYRALTVMVKERAIINEVYVAIDSVAESFKAIREINSP